MIVDCKDTEYFCNLKRDNRFFKSTFLSVFVKDALLPCKTWSFTRQKVFFYIAKHKLLSITFNRGKKRLAIPLSEKRHPKGSGWAS